MCIILQVGGGNERMVDSCTTASQEKNIKPIRPLLQAEPDVAHLRYLMRYVVKKPEEAAGVGRAARRAILDNFSADAVAGVALALLREAADS